MRLLETEQEGSKTFLNVYLQYLYEGILYEL